MFKENFVFINLALLFRRCNIHRTIAKREQLACEPVLIIRRLWLVPYRIEVKATSLRCEQLRVRDFYPSEKEGLSHLIKRVNRHLEDQPCWGRLLSTPLIITDRKGR